MVGGILITLAGAIFRSRSAMKIGVAVFLFGLPLCGFANVIPFIRVFIQTAHETGFRDLLRDMRRQPLPWIFIWLIFLTYLMLGIGGTVAVLASLGMFRRG
jgi:hypothetical protein